MELEERDADNIVSPHMGTSYSLECNKRVMEHYQVTPQCEMNAKMIVPVVKSPMDVGSTQRGCGGNEHGRRKERR